MTCASGVMNHPTNAGVAYATLTVLHGGFGNQWFTGACASHTVYVPAAQSFIAMRPGRGS